MYLGALLYFANSFILLYKILNRLLSYFEGSTHKWLPLLFEEFPTFHFQLKVERDEMTTNYQDEDS